MSDQAKEAARKGLADVAAILKIDGVPPEAFEALAVLIVGAIKLVGGVAEAHAKAAGLEAAAKITNAEEAEAAAAARK